MQVGFTFNTDVIHHTYGRKGRKKAFIISKDVMNRKRRKKNKEGGIGRGGSRYNSSI